MKKSELKQLGFDYIALGHIHKLDYNSEENQRIVYPGSTISLGFDELGQHGMIVGNIEKEKVELEFIPIDNKELKEINVEVTNINDKEEKLLGGTSYEDVLEGYEDIVGAILKLKEIGYKEVYLQGHSLGCTKIVYTYNCLLYTSPSPRDCS